MDVLQVWVDENICSYWGFTINAQINIISISILARQ